MTDRDIADKPAEPKANILLVDDNEENLFALEVLLQDMGQNLIQASSGREALKCLLHHNVSVILLDVKMPGVDGFETAALIRERESLRHTPILFVTAFDLTADDVFKGYSLGAVDFIFKPLVPEILRSKVGVFVDLFRKTEQIRRQSEALRTSNAELERRVRERTAQLETANDELRREIVERERLEKIVRESEERYRAFIRQSSEGIWRFELEEPIPANDPPDVQIEKAYRHAYLAECNDAMAQMYGFASAQDIIGARMGDLLVRSDPKNAEFLRAFVNSGYKLTQAESHEVDKAGRPRFFLMNFVGIVENGLVRRAWGTQTDVTEKKRAEERIKASLREKEVLLKEIHHRVKNNMQIISSLLTLQAEHGDGHPALRVLQDCRERVKTMALIHEKLYRSGDLGKIDFADYLRSLVQNLFDSYVARPDIVRLELDVVPVFLDLDRAVPCGMLVYELVSNCLKHAFPNARPGTVRLSLRADKTHRVTLSVRDDGVGLPEHLDVRDTESLGMQLVCRLVEQLNGTLDIKNRPGTEVRIEFQGAKTSNLREAVS